jgi:glycosyltransferase involved in cell wall biosynthesis
LARKSRVFDRVRWLGERHDVAALLASADLYCQPNLEPEPFGMVFIEALAAGLPVVTSASGGALEIVDESCGRLVAANDRPALAAALRSLIDDRALRAQLAAAGPERARRLCDPAAVERELFDVLSGMTRPAARHTPVAVGA